MKLINVDVVRKFWKKHKETESQLRSLIGFIEKAKWGKPGDIKKQFAKASILSSNRVVFNICGNNYRLIVKINYDLKIVYVQFIDTHEKYDKINAEEI